MSEARDRSSDATAGLMRYAYVLLLGVSSGVIFLKTWLLSFMMNEAQFAAFNYYLVIAGVLALITPLGLLLTCHTRLPGLLAENDDEGVARLAGAAKATIVVMAAITLLLGTFLTGGSPGLWFGVLQGSLFALFVIDQIIIKSRLAMLRYAGNLIARNLIIAGAGVCAFWVFGTATASMVGETLGTLAWCAIGGTLVWRWPRPSEHMEIVRQSAPFAAVTALGCVLTMGDRALASRALPEAEFALFSYYYLAVLAALAMQQAVNTRFLAVVSLRTDAAENAADATRHAFVMFTLSALAACVVMLALSLNTAYSSRADTTILALFVLLAGLRGADFFQAVLLARSERKRVLVAQGCYLTALTATWIWATELGGLLAGMAIAASGYLTLVGTMTWWGASAGVGRDDRI